MKKTLCIIGLCAVLLLMPTLLAFPTTNNSSPLFSPLKMSDGTFAGGFGRGHWGNGGFNIDSVAAYMNGVYTGSGFVRLSGELTNSYNVKIGDINAYIISNIIFGHTRNAQGQQAPLVVILMKHQNDQFVGRIIVSNIRPAAHLWGYLIPNI